MPCTPKSLVLSCFAGLQDVTSTLHSYDAQNIDMSLAMSLEERGSQSLHAPLDARRSPSR